MENPGEEITSVVLRLTSSSSPEKQRNAIEQYMTPDVAFRHPLCSVESGPNSRTTVLGIYQWYRVLSPKVEARVESVVWDPVQNYLFLDVVQWFSLFFSPFDAAPSRLCVRLTLRKDDNGLYYISQQEDFYHTDDFTSLLVPPLASFVHMLLLMTGLSSLLYARIAQIFGYWHPTSKSAEQEPVNEQSEGDLYSNIDEHENKVDSLGS